MIKTWKFDTTQLDYWNKYSYSYSFLLFILSHTITVTVIELNFTVFFGLLFYQNEWLLCAKQMINSIFHSYIYWRALPHPDSALDRMNQWYSEVFRQILRNSKWNAIHCGDYEIMNCLIILFFLYFVVERCCLAHALS